ncbi:Putative ketoacyl reductase [Marinovum algicola]|uniref:3-oxoacyl-[acyl-carrier protein] reductase n=1 Tax=Marinovum algicola TaxID=42444 RepID=A0A975ZPC1_9RHOB|nr:SDR family NAD(P)-dependent oxidoreductase [Marinovum algicola]SEJ83454.1 3-oxoacyl-[acyl-carrier protein] reductase [Marinovum algicola]SLN62286.1 Putative ketoacyl reductase [Marinovum algicola]
MNTYDLKGKRALVTGGGSGIGLATARLYLQSGAQVAIWGRNPDKLETARRDLSEFGDVLTASVDVSDADQVGSAARALLSEWGGLDILFNCAGHSVAFGPFPTLSLDVWRQAHAINLDSVFHTCQAFLPGMLDRGWGRIINTTSQAAKDGSPQMSPYVSAKAGVIGLTKSLGRELAATGVLVNAICPTVFETPLVDEMSGKSPGAMDAAVKMIPMQRMGRPEEAAEMVAWLSSPGCSFNAGTVFDLSGGRAVY